MYEEAFILLEMYGSERVPLKQLVRICSQTVLDPGIRRKTPCCSPTAISALNGEKYDDNILTYLLMYYDGPVEDMKRLWNVGREFELDTMVLEEKTPQPPCFSPEWGTSRNGTDFCLLSEKVWGRRKICRAYLILKSYEYFCKGPARGGRAF